MTMPSPVMPGAEVVTVPFRSGRYCTIMSSLLPKPPVARMTAFVVMVTSWVLLWAFTPDTAPFSVRISVARVS